MLTGVLFIDLNKAFDTINQVLLYKLEMFGFCETNLKWFKSYLSFRQECVGWNGTLSKPRDITIGVPQRSILGPLFLFYLFSIPNFEILILIVIYLGLIILIFLPERYLRKLVF